MRGSHAKTAPRALTVWLARKSADWQPSYPFPADIRQPVVDGLMDAQRGLCVYCGRNLDMSHPGKSFHIEHFRPRSGYPNLETDFANLFLSCGPESDSGNPSQICGNAKAGRFDEAACIEPDYPACTNRFSFLLTGEIAPDAEDDAPAAAMIDLLNLNHPELRTDRRDFLYLLDKEELDLSDFLASAGGSAPRYAHMVYRRFGAVMP